MCRQDSARPGLVCCAGRAQWPARSVLAWPRAARPEQTTGRDHECGACRAAWACVTARRRCAQVHNVAGLEKHKLELKYDTFSQISVIEHEARLNRFLKAKWAADSSSVRTAPQICNLNRPPIQNECLLSCPAARELLAAALARVARLCAWVLCAAAERKFAELRRSFSAPEGALSS